MDTHEKRLDFMMLHDFLRAVDKNYFIHEIYPGLGTFRKYDRPFDMDFKTYTSISSAAKGIVYWQYRSERLGHEMDCSGIMHMDGSPREVAFAVRDFGANLKNNMKYMVGAEVKPAEVAIVFDFNSMLISEIEDTLFAPDFTFDWANPQFYYRNAHAGMYRLLRNSDYPVDYVGVTRPEEFSKYKVLYFPYYTMLDPEIVPILEEYLKNGGIIIADEGFGLRQMNTWIQPYDIDCKALFTSRMKYRRLVGEDLAEIDGSLVKIRPYRTHYDHTGGETVATWRDGCSAAQRFDVGKGSFYLLGFSVGYSYYTFNEKSLADFIEKILSSAGVEKNKLSDTLGGVYEKRLRNGEYEIIFLFNNTNEDKLFDLESEIVSYSDTGSIKDGKACVPANGMAYFVTK